MSRFPPFSRYETGAASARVRDLLVRLRLHMRDEAILDEAIARLATELNVRPGEAAEQLARMAKHSGLELVEVARGIERPPDEPRQAHEVPAWVTGMLEAIHASALYLAPVRDASGRVVDFLILAANRHARTAAGRTAAEVAGRRLMAVSPGVAGSGLLDDYISAFETGEPVHREGLEFVEVLDYLLWPATLNVRAARVDDGLLVSWRPLDDEELLVSGWERAQRLAELGWGEWNLATQRTLWTPQMYEMFGRDRNDGPMSLEDLPTVVVPEDLPIVEDLMRSLLEHREAVETEFRIQQRHGVRHLCVFSEPLLDADGVPVKVRFLAQDVTKNRRRERALAVAHEQAHRQRQRAEEEHRVTVRLQDTILPIRRGLIHLPGLAVGVRYLPGEELIRLGGDWFKARLLPDGRVLIAIGDAMGHGLTATSIMLQMRSGLAGLAYTQQPAGQLATWLNDLIVHSNQGVTVTGTAIIGHFDPGDCTFRWTNAGHPAPVLIRDGRPEPIDGVQGVMLGAFDVSEYQMTTTQLRSGDVLLLYTDGIVERRGQDLEVGMEALLQAAHLCSDDDPERMIDCLLNRLGGDAAEDDVCVLAVRVL
ncbi:serine phosphatase RsbU (regulator of sigma subunit) [Nonomuraea thailandensis]|uniref:Serine phosphatase RsbU (Regulator of sigma subunit) n=1 Tax=Nonomuraea thailandensis TaxID=1188745 RepID=A0A9X2K8W1_9ACTN|nr:PP2C family protein-serine/threonine phosphatase [Nonomuraea thailandensis]MCP2365092.1 serine phosphatase RsbU (regulator of sigma subunit) [Nonomuraea thailandensis]